MSNSEFELKSLSEVPKQVTLSPITTKIIVINNQSVIAKVYPMGYAIQPMAGRVMLTSRLGYVKNENKSYGH